MCILRQDSRYYDPADGTYIKCFQRSHGSVTTAAMRREGTEFQVPLVVTWTDGTTEGEKLDIAATWIGGNLLCPSGHSIPCRGRHARFDPLPPLGLSKTEPPISHLKLEVKWHVR